MARLLVECKFHETETGKQSEGKRGNGRWALVLELRSRGVKEMGFRIEPVTREYGIAVPSVLDSWDEYPVG